MIPYLIITVVALFSIGHFGHVWKTLAILSALTTVYALTLGVYIQYQFDGVSFNNYLATVPTVYFLEVAAITALEVSLKVLAIFGGSYVFLKITGRLPRNA